MIDIKARIRYFQDLKGLNNEDMANACNISVSTINSLFASKYNPTIVTLDKLCVGLGITMSQFFVLENENYELTQWHKDSLLALDALPPEKRDIALIILREIK